MASTTSLKSTPGSRLNTPSLKKSLSKQMFEYLKRALGRWAAGWSRCLSSLCDTVWCHLSADLVCGFRVRWLSLWESCWGREKQGWRRCKQSREEGDWDFFFFLILRTRERGQRGENRWTQWREKLNDEVRERGQRQWEWRSEMRKRERIMKDINSVPLCWWPVRFARLKQHRWVPSAHTTNGAVARVQVRGAATPASLCSLPMRLYRRKNYSYIKSYWITSIMGAIRQFGWRTNKWAQLVKEVVGRGAHCGFSVVPVVQKKSDWQLCLPYSPAVCLASFISCL